MTFNFLIIIFIRMHTCLISKSKHHFHELMLTKLQIHTSTNKHKQEELVTPKALIGNQTQTLGLKTTSNLAIHGNCLKVTIGFFFNKIKYRF